MLPLANVTGQFLVGATMAGKIVCARCGKILTDWDMSQGHECNRFFYGRWEIREEETVFSTRPDLEESEGQPARENSGAPQLVLCPKCGQKSLSFNTILLLWECLNISCRARVANDDLDPASRID